MDQLSDQELSTWNETRFFGGVHINAKVLQNITSELIAARAELKRLREAMGNNCNALTDADYAYLIAHLSYELEPVGKPPTWNQLAIEVIRLSNALALKGGAA